MTVEKSGIVGAFVAVIGNITTAGDAEDTTTEVFIVINEINFKIVSCSIIDALQYCYKSFFVLNVDFPCECKHIWTFMQSNIYQNSVETAKTYIVLEKFTTELNKI